MMLRRANRYLTPSMRHACACTMVVISLIVMVTSTRRVSERVPRERSLERAGLGEVG
jgi:hypothetical protein